MLKGAGPSSSDVILEMQRELDEYDATQNIDHNQPTMMINDGDSCSKKGSSVTLFKTPRRLITSTASPATSNSNDTAADQQNQLDIVTASRTTLTTGIVTRLQLLEAVGTGVLDADDDDHGLGSFDDLFVTDNDLGKLNC